MITAYSGRASYNVCMTNDDACNDEMDEFFAVQDFVIDEQYSDGTLTATGAMLYLQSHKPEKGDETKMKGTIRVKGKCPECGTAFRHTKVGYICPRCKTLPKKYYLDLFHKGQRIRIFCDKQGIALDTYTRAEKLQSHINTQMDNREFELSHYVKAEMMQFYVSTLLDRFFEDKLPAISPSRTGHYKRYTEMARDFFKTKDIRDIKKIDISDYKKHLIKKYYSDQPKQGKSLKNVLDHFKTFMLYCLKEYEIIARIPGFPTVELQPYQFKWLDQADQLSLYDMFDDRHKPFVGFLMLHGCRPGEARALKCKDVDLKNNRVTISATFSRETYKERRKGRGARPVTVPLHSELYDFVAERVKNNLPEAFVFTVKNGGHYSENHVYRLWEKVREKAKLDKSLRLYDITRHSFASQLVNSDTSLFRVSKLLGHSSVKMTEKYAHQDIEKLKTDIEKLSLKEKATVTRPSPEAKTA